MLNPNDRSLLVDSLRPPPGHRFVAGVALTYSLDLTTLLTIPLHLAVLGSDRREELLKDPVALMESLRRTASSLVIVCQQGRISVPAGNNVLYGLLENSVIQVNAPHGGVFHPKLWALRYEDVESKQEVIRLIVLSRNLTPDRCWDLSLMLEGSPAGRTAAVNRPLVELLGSIPRWATRTVSEPIALVLTEIADLLGRTKWDELPAGFDDVEFQVFGIERKAWKPDPSDRMAVISPFLRSDALEHLLDRTSEGVALISRPEELARVAHQTLSRFSRCLTLHEQAETDDGEDITSANGISDLSGLHAKAYIVERGWYTTLYLGSANATNASLLGGGNVEILVGLTGKTSQVGGIEDLLGGESLADYLTEFTPQPEPTPLTIEEQAEDLLNAARDLVCRADLRINIESAGEDAFIFCVRAAEPISLPRIVSFRAWPVSVPPDRAVDASVLLSREEVLRFGPVSAASLTSFFAFELKSDVCDLRLCFVLNLPVTNMPAHRDAAVLRTIISNREGFLRYLLMLLMEDGQSALLSELAAALGAGDAAKWRWRSVEELPLLEEMTRAYSEDPRRLHAIKRMVDQLLAAPNGKDIVPPEFLEVWQVYESMLDMPADSSFRANGVES